MNRFIPDETINEIRSSCDIVEVINSYLPLKKTGGRFKALCPFHNEKTPSFTVSPDKQIFHCFGCGKGGDVFRFIMDREGVDFPNAAHILAQKCGIMIPEETPGSSQGQTKEKANQRERLYKLHEILANWYSENLSSNPSTPVARYLETRRLPEDLIRKFSLGASPDSWDAAIKLAIGEGFNREELLLSGIVVESEKSPGGIYDRFRNRLVFPIQNEQGRVVGFSARSIEENIKGAKYVNSPETPIFLKSRVLYGLPLARQEIQNKGFIILCEGQMDVIAMHRAGFENCAAPQGTAFTEEQARIIKRYTDRVFLAFDSDSAGMKAAARAVEILLPLDFDVNVIVFPEGRDPDDILKDGGREKIEELVSGALTFFDFLMRGLSANFDFASPEGKGHAVSEMIRYLQLIGNSVVRSSYAGKLAHVLGVPETAVYSEINRKRKALSSYRENNSEAPRLPEQNPAYGVDKNVMKAEEALLEAALSHGTIAKKLSSELPQEMISSTSIGKALETVILCSLNGEWELAQHQIKNMLIENPDPSVSRILASNGETQKDILEKTVDDCIKTIKKSVLSGKIQKLTASLRNETDSAKKTELMREFQEIQKQLLSL